MQSDSDSKWQVAANTVDLKNEATGLPKVLRQRIPLPTNSSCNFGLNIVFKAQQASQLRSKS